MGTYWTIVPRIRESPPNAGLLNSLLLQRQGLWYAQFS